MSKNPALWGVISFCAGTGFNMSEWHSNAAAFGFWGVSFLLVLYAIEDWLRLPNSR